MWISDSAWTTSLSATSKAAPVAKATVVAPWVRFKTAVNVSVLLVEVQVPKLLILITVPTFNLPAGIVNVPASAAVKVLLCVVEVPTKLSVTWLNELSARLWYCLEILVFTVPYDCWAMIFYFYKIFLRDYYSHVNKYNRELKKVTLVGI